MGPSIGEQRQSKRPGRTELGWSKRYNIRIQLSHRCWACITSSCILFSHYLSVYCSMPVYSMIDQKVIVNLIGRDPKRPLFKDRKRKLVTPHWRIGSRVGSHAKEKWHHVGQPRPGRCRCFCRAQTMMGKKEYRLRTSPESLGQSTYFTYHFAHTRSIA